MTSPYECHKKARVKLALYERVYSREESIWETNMFLSETILVIIGYDVGLTLVFFKLSEGRCDLKAIGLGMNKSVPHGLLPPNF